MKTKLIEFPDYNIIVSDELKIGDKEYYLSLDFNEPYIVNLNEVNETDMEHIHLKIIASDNPEHNLPSIDYNGFEEEFGVVDVENYLENFIIKHNIKNDDTRLGYTKLGYINGLKDMKSLTNKKFSLSDMEKAYFNNEVPHDNFDFNLFIKSLQQPKIFDIEIEMEQINNKHNSPSYSVKTQFRPKITNNKVKIIKVIS